MATYSAFLRKEGIDYTMAKNPDKTIGVSPAHFNPDAAYGKVFWVDETTGSDDSDGLSPINAFATVAAAITANNLAFDANNHNQNTMYINAQTYTENLTVFPKNCNVIAIGGKVRIQGNHVFSHAQNSRWYNVQFRCSTGGVPIISATGNCHGLAFYGCVFDSQAAITENILYAGNSSDLVVDNCRMGYETNATNSPDYAIRFAGVAAQRAEITNNRIWTTGVGIQIESTMTSGGFLLIENNKISNNPARDNQMAFGIKDLTPSPSGALIIHNYISAVDAIFYTVTGAKSQNLTINNYVNQAGTATREDSF